MRLLRECELQNSLGNLLTVPGPGGGVLAHGQLPGEPLLVLGTGLGDQAPLGDTAVLHGDLVEGHVDVLLVPDPGHRDPRLALPLGLHHRRLTDHSC